MITLSRLICTIAFFVLVTASLLLSTAILGSEALAGCDDVCLAHQCQWPGFPAGYRDSIGVGCCCEPSPYNCRICVTQ